MFKVGDMVSRRWQEGYYAETTGVVVEVTSTHCKTRHFDGGLAIRENWKMRRCLITLAGVVRL